MTAFCGKFSSYQLCKYINFILFSPPGLLFSSQTQQRLYLKSNFKNLKILTERRKLGEKAQTEMEQYRCHQQKRKGKHEKEDMATHEFVWAMMQLRVYWTKQMNPFMSMSLYSIWSSSLTENICHCSLKHNAKMENERHYHCWKWCTWQSMCKYPV